MAWIPIFIFLPLAIFLFDQNTRTKRDGERVASGRWSVASEYKEAKRWSLASYFFTGHRPLTTGTFFFASPQIESYIYLVRHNALSECGSCEPTLPEA